MSFNELISAVESAAADAVKKEPDDYIGEDGLLYCGKCHTQKQCEIEVLGQIHRPYCLCKCEQERQEQAEAEERRLRRIKRIERLRSEGFPSPEMQSWTFENDDGKNPKITAIARKYADNFDELYKDGKGLLLFGGVGTGKTYAAACIANELIDRGRPCLVTNFARLVNRINGLFDERQEFIDSLDDYDLLVIDDLAAERDTDYMNEIVQSVIDARYRAKKPLIVTTNLDAEELKNPRSTTKMRVYSRLYEMCIPVEVAGTDRRRGKLWEASIKYNEILGLREGKNED